MGQKVMPCPHESRGPRSRTGLVRKKAQVPDQPVLLLLHLSMALSKGLKDSTEKSKTVGRNREMILKLFGNVLIKDLWVKSRGKSSLNEAQNVHCFPHRRQFFRIITKVIIGENCSETSQRKQSS